MIIINTITPYLIQRGEQRVVPDTTRKGIDQLIKFDYMGSAEFEFGALGDSLKAIRNNDPSEYECRNVRVKDVKNKMVTVFAKKSQIDEIIESINHLADNKYHLKGYSNFPEWFNGKLRQSEKCDFWWDIENHFMFWVTGDGQFGEKLVAATINQG